MEENVIQTIGEELVKVLEAKNQARELALTNSRATIRHCAHSIRASHRGEQDRGGPSHSADPTRRRPVYTPQRWPLKVTSSAGR